MAEDDEHSNEATLNCARCNRVNVSGEADLRAEPPAIGAEGSHHIKEFKRFGAKRQ